MANLLVQPGLFLLGAESEGHHWFLQDHPGWYFVIATLLPLVSFLLLLLSGTLRYLFRRYRDTWGNGLYNLFGGDQPSPLPAYVATAAIGLAFVFSLTGFIVHSTESHHDERDREKLQETESKLFAQIHHDPDLNSKSLQELKGELEKAEAEQTDLKKKITAAEKEKEPTATLRTRLETVEKELKELAPVEKLVHTQEERARLESRWAGRLTWLSINPSGLPDPAQATSLELGFFIDGLSALMFLMVTFVATLIHLFSIGYMGDELQETVEDHNVHTEEGHLHRRGRFGRFFLYMSLFCFSMLNLVLADNLFQVFLSWELVGICSYLLIGFYYERQSASNAANKAFITNRIGDAGFILGLLILWSYVGTFNFQDIFNRLRCPAGDTHEKLLLAGRIVRAQEKTSAQGSPLAPRVGGDSRSESPTMALHVQQMQQDYNPSDAPGYGQVVLFPRVLGQNFHGVKPSTSDEDSTVTVYDNPGPTQYGHIPTWVLIVAGLGIFLGCVGKSAQFPLQVWLPDAMEGPTPVSALIHAATMVAAGVYLVGRAYPIFTREVLLVIAYTGGITLFVAATIAVVMTDIKKVLAYSTVSQLGYMMLALGVGGWVAGLFHLITHAVFKALLFLGSGSVIYGCHHEQDMTKMGGLFPKMKITALTMLAGLFAIAGIPLFTGWYSKDAIVVQALGFAAVNPKHLILFVLPLVTAGITAFYMSRMWLLTFTGKPRDQHVYDHAHESPWLMTAPLVILAVLSVVAAWGWPMWDAQESYLEQHLHHAQPTPSIHADFGHVPYSHEVHPAAREFLQSGDALPEELNVRYQAARYHALAGGLALLMVALGALFAWLLYGAHVFDPAEAQEQMPGLHTFLAHKWFFDEVYSVLVVRPSLVVALAFRWFDQTVIDGIINGIGRLTVRVADWDGIFDRNIIDGLVNVVGGVFYGIGGSLRRVQTGYLRSYVLFLVLAAVGIFVVLSYYVAMASAG